MEADVTAGMVVGVVKSFLHAVDGSASRLVHREPYSPWCVGLERGWGGSGD